MEKSIESIWKKGFINESISIPSINNLNELKSIYFMDQFKKRYQINVIILTLTAILVLLAFVIGGIPIIGLFMFTLFASLALIGKSEINKLDQLSKGSSNYEFIKDFDDWLKNLLRKFALIYRIWVPLLFIGFSLAILHTNFFIPFIGETLIEKFVPNSNSTLFFGMPIPWLFGLLGIAAILSYCSSFFFKLEMKTLYGDLIGRLDDLLKELHALN